MKYKLGEIFSLQMGKTPDRHSPEFWSEGTESWISIADLSKCNKYIENTAEKITMAAIEESGIKPIPRNTVIMSFKLSIGKVAITPKEMYSNEAIMAFIDKGVFQIEPAYLYYLLMHRDWNVGTNKAVMGKTLNKATLSQISINIHELSEQHEITKVLDAISSIIEARKQQLQKLDELVKARFIEMFGDPVVNKKGWDAEILNNLCNGIGDGLHGTPEYDDAGKYAFINGNNLMNGAIEVTPSTKMVNAETFGKYYIEISENAILLSINGTLGKLAFYNGEEIILGKSACYCNLKSEINREFVYGVMQTNAFSNFLERNATASTIKNVGLKAIREFRLILPPEGLQKQFVKFSKQVDKSKAVAQKALDEAQLLFDSLMQKYFE